MILPILKVPHEKLTEKSEPISELTEDLKSFGRDLLETMISQHGLGLAAIQVNKPLRIIAMMHGEKDIVMFNPVIIAKSPIKEAGKEGCLSFEKGVTYKVKRPNAVKVKYIDIYGKNKFLYLQGLDARVFLHEEAHLRGVTMDHEGTLV